MNNLNFIADLYDDAVMRTLPKIMQHLSLNPLAHGFQVTELSMQDTVSVGLQKQEYLPSELSG